MMTAATVAAVSVSVLNATYQPLGTTKLARAMALVGRGDAVIEEFDTLRTLRHKTGEFLWPTVIRLLRYVNVSMRYGPQAWTKAGVLKRDGHVCAYCKTNPGTTIDHVLPRAKGGRDTWLNTVACCQPCNALKGDRMLDENNSVSVKVGHKTITLTLAITPTEPMRVYNSGKRAAVKKNSYR